ncbi:hypothetical protein LguiA_002787 [Lonicera macranthoides]
MPPSLKISSTAIVAEWSSLVVIGLATTPCFQDHLVLVEFDKADQQENHHYPRLVLHVPEGGTGELLCDQELRAHDLPGGNE